MLPLTWTSERTEQEGRVNCWGEGEEEERVDFLDEKDVNEQQRWNELVLAQSSVEELLQQQPQSQQPHLPSAAAPNPWPDEGDCAGEQPMSSPLRGG